jgi:hypothetical protein
MKKQLALTVLAAIGLISAACGSPALAPALEYRSAGDAAVGGAPMPAEAPSAPGLVEPVKSEYSSGAPAAERIVIQTGSLTIVVADPAGRVAEIRQMAETMGGFVVSSYIYKTAYGTQGLTADQATITVRVPAERLDEALAQIKQGASEVRSENISGEDVTQQYTDLQSRLRNLEAAEAQLLDIMQGATKTEDVLAVYNQLVQVRGEIESVKGQIQYYSESAALSAITVEIIPDEAAQPIETGSWDPNGTVKNAIEALIRALQWLADAAIWIAIYVLPVLLLAVGLPLLVIVLIVRAFRRRRTAKPKTDA